MTSKKTSVSNLVDICAAHGIKDIVFSPGSRNAPLIIAFNNDDRFNCICIHDERVAAFYALGISQLTKVPTLLSCTSGSAAYNYAPAIAEAYYQSIPLLVCSADRPVEWIDQGNGQTIRQNNIFGSHVHGSYQLLQEADHEDELWYNDRSVNEAIIQSKLTKGPVHINIPIREPLYEVKQTEEKEAKIISITESQSDLPDEEWIKLSEIWNKTDRKLILVGQAQPDSLLTGALTALCVDRSVVLMTETTSNVNVSGQISSIDRTIAGLSDHFSTYQPELLLTVGGEVVSKKIKALLRKHKPVRHWHISELGKVTDTYQALTKIIKMDAVAFLEGLVNRIQPQWNAEYAPTWQKLIKARARLHQDFIDQSPWSDFQVFGHVLSEIPSQSILHLANSTPIRYHQLFNQRFDLECYCNRGTSGIDGSTSTAAGMASVADKMVTIITGDTSFFYDSNALWVNNLSPGFRIIVINNEGGNIFRVIPGPDTTKELDAFFEAHHSANAQGLAKAFNIDFQSCENENQLIEILPSFFSEPEKGPRILEIKTPRMENDGVLKDYFRFISKEV